MTDRPTVDPVLAQLISHAIDGDRESMKSIEMTQPILARLVKRFMNGNYIDDEAFARALRGEKHPRMHGMSDSPEYRTWTQMIQRCENPKNSSYADYGGRGIRVCAEWHDAPDGFRRFLKDMGKRPDGCSIDRIDVNGNYEAKNCRWATAQVQASNKRNSKRI